MLKQSIQPERQLFLAGESITFRLEGAPENAAACVRTNLGFAGTMRQEIIGHTENGSLREGMAWHDRPMKKVPGGFELTLPLLEPGVYEAKCCCRTANGILWPESRNFFLKVESAENAAPGTIYCAFVRQFRDAAPQTSETVLKTLDQQGYTVIPPSGTFRSLIRRLDRIFGELHCRILQLLPVHPAPSVYGRMGRFGSPFASLDYFAVDPALAEFDPKATPMEQFGELADAVHARRGRLFLDIPVNHTGWASRLQNEHPEYFVRGADRTFESPGAWGVVWADLCKLDYRKTEVRRVMAEVFLFWCRHGVDGFRCDAGYMLPVEAWEYIVAKVRSEYPDTVFMLEGLGGPPETQTALLTQAGLDWAYSELFQNYDRDAVTRYFPVMDQSSRQAGTLVNFAETHDNPRLAATSRTYAAMRCALCALLAENGTFGFANGVENFAAERIDVHGAGSLNEGAEPNLIPLLRRLNDLLARHPAFAPGAEITSVISGGGNGAAFLRRGTEGEALLVLVNLDCQNPLRIHWKNHVFPADPAVDLLTDRTVSLFTDETGPCMELPPGGYCCLGHAALHPEDLPEPRRVTRQRADLAARTVLWHFQQPLTGDPGEELRRGPWAFLTRVAGGRIPPVTEYSVERDSRRLVPLPPGDWLLLVHPQPFRAELRQDGRTCRTGRSIPAADGTEFMLLPPLEDAPDTMTECEMLCTVFPPNQSPRHSAGKLLRLPAAEKARFRMSFTGEEAAASNLAAFGANCRGGYTMMRAAFGRISSKYDAVLAANGTAPYPDDRHVLLTRLRAWLAVDGYSYAIDERVLCNFTAGTNCARWFFRIPSGQGRITMLTVDLAVSRSGEGVELHFSRAMPRPDAAPEVRIILRPDVECRINHEVTRAYAGPEKSFPAAVQPQPDGFTFAPDPAFPLHAEIQGGRFVPEPEWKYMEHLEMEARYGLQAQTDLFSPGYCEFPLHCAETRVFRAWCGNAPPEDLAPVKALAKIRMPLEAAESALAAYPAKRDELATVIAGYPWFLDWGRDTLIALRGLIAAGLKDGAADILSQFAGFEENGTIPNIIHGAEVGNRDTCDAPLWLGTAAADYVKKFGSDLLKRNCRGRTFAAILESIVRHYRAGTPNGIRADARSGLVFSPPHFTWMDTNYPAGTPREGYPVEIQALWAAMLEITGDHDGAEQVRKSLDRLFYRPELGRFSDCLHGTGTAETAVADDHLRPNQLLAVTLGAVTAPDRQAAIVRSSAELLTPGAIRSLADRSVTFPLPVTFHGKLLNDPAHPYIGHYRGAEDTSRKAAYHNGTAWGWLFPSFCEALAMTGGDRERARALLYSGAYRADRGIPGQIAEIADGDAPHAEQGCSAQAWSMTEFYRVAEFLL